MIRITGGKNRSRLLETPNTNLTKPTMDKVRSAVFNALGESIENARVLDLFAGSGSYGFESLSRGAKSVTFVEKGAEAISVIKKNSLYLRENDVEIARADVLDYLNSTEEKFDIVFADPPYKLEVYEELLKTLLERKIISENGIIVLESEKELNIEKDKFRDVRFYKYGLAKIYILRK